MLRKLIYILPLIVLFTLKLDSFVSKSNYEIAINLDDDESNIPDNESEETDFEKKEFDKFICFSAALNCPTIKLVSQILTSDKLFPTFKIPFVGPPPQ